MRDNNEEPIPSGCLFIDRKDFFLCFSCFDLSIYFSIYGTLRFLSRFLVLCTLIKKHPYMFIIFMNLVFKVLNKSTLFKVFIIFVFGLTTRFLVNDFFSINVFSDYLHPISLLYYLFMSFFIACVHEFF